MGTPVASASWLPSPAATPLGELELAGILHDRTGIRAEAPRTMTSFALVYVAAGKGYYWDSHLGHRSLVAGDLITVFPGVPHAYGPSGGQAWEQIYFVFKGPVFDVWNATGLLSVDAPIRHAEPVDYWRARFQEIVEPQAVASAAESHRILGRFLKLGCDLAALVPGQEAEAPWIQAASTLLGRPERGRWPSAEEVARNLGVGYEAFRKQFARRMGIAPGMFQRKRKIERACAALYQGGVSLKELADQLGFSDVFHFSKVFKKHTGTTPAAFRKRTRGGAGT